MQQFGGPNCYPATPQMHQMHRGNAQAMMNMEVDTGYDPSNESETSAQTPQQRGHRRSRNIQGNHSRPRKRHVMLNIKGKDVMASFWEP